MVLSPMDVILDYGRALVVQPDLMFISRERAGIVQHKVHGRAGPRRRNPVAHPRIGRLNEQVGWFARYGVRECWLVHLSPRQFSVLILNEHGVVERRSCRPGESAPSDVLPGVILPSLDA